MAKYVIEEAKRCLQCKKPLCKEGCPVKTPINEVINMFLNGKIREAGEKLFKNNPLSVVCSLVCPHEEQCEGHCVLNKSKKLNPIQFGLIEHYISDYYLNLFTPEHKPIDPNKKVAIIGSGPAGITIAFILAEKGYDITIFEFYDKIGGVLRYGIPDFRLPKSILERIKDKLIEMGVKIRPNTMIDSHITIDDLFRDGYKAVFIGIGVWQPNRLKIKGESLGHVHFAINYLKNPDVYNLGKSLCVIGAGNVAMDVARTALRKGVRDVYIMYRKGPEHVSASKSEVECAKLDGVKFEFYKQPVEILDEGVKYVETKFIKDDEGNEKLVTIDGTEKIFEVDSVIIATGQGPRGSITSQKEIKMDKHGLVITDDCGRTTREGVFASGDIVTGAKTVVEAVRASKRVAEAIDEYVSKHYNEKKLKKVDEH
ncbi:NAD(P)-dependent oxidoreductase [Peptococcaceae bacterium]|nr:NAD(P)-dependent oxidoreductase [Peptococcaceae bacterium]